MTKISEKKKIDFKETLWKAADKLRNQMDAAEYKHIVLGLIFLKYISDTFDIQKDKIKKMVSNPKSDFFISEDPKIYEKELEDRDYYTQDNIFWVPQKSRWEKIRAQAKQSDIGSIIDRAMVDIEKENKFLVDKLDKRFGRTELQEGKLGELIDLISKIGFDSQNSSIDILGEIYEYFLGQFALAEGKKGGQFYTPECVVKLLVNILEPLKGRVYDPCCGSGGMFVQSEKFVKSHGGKINDISIYGQESNPTTRRLAAMNLAIRGFSADLGKISDDTFGKDQFPDTKFDFVLANPHFNDSDWGGEKYENDPRWIFGRPPVGNANFAWLQHIFWKLSKNGKAGIVLANGSMSAVRNGEDDIRKEMINNDIVEIMVSLPGQLFHNTQVPVCIWFLSKNKKYKNDRSNQVLFFDCRNLGKMKTRTMKYITDDEINKLSEKVKSWKFKKDYKDEDNFCKSVNIEQIKKNDFYLTPSRYVDRIDKELNTDLGKKIKELFKEYKNLSEEEKEIDEIFNQNIKFLEK